jgi:hypothetical protein
MDPDPGDPKTCAIVDPGIPNTEINKSNITDINTCICSEELRSRFRN